MIGMFAEGPGSIVYYCTCGCCEIEESAFTKANLANETKGCHCLALVRLGLNFAPYSLQTFDSASKSSFFYLAVTAQF